MLKKIQTTSLSHVPSQEYSRILSAAVINANFRSMLLNDPATAVTGGYSGEKFNLGNVEKQHLSSIHANSLADFAVQLINY
jgi:hypothetical protein